jgi:hypothetical protein
MVPYALCARNLMSFLHVSNYVSGKGRRDERTEWTGNEGGDKHERLWNEGRKGKNEKRKEEGTKKDVAWVPSLQVRIRPSM